MVVCAMNYDIVELFPLRQEMDRKFSHPRISKGSLPWALSVGILCI